MRTMVAFVLRIAAAGLVSERHLTRGEWRYPKQKCPCTACYIARIADEVEDA